MKTTSIAYRSSHVRCQHQSAFPWTAERVRESVRCKQSLTFLIDLCSDLRKLGMNLVPFPRVGPILFVFSILLISLPQQLHFLMPSYAPFYDPKAKHFEGTSIPELTKA